MAIRTQDELLHILRNGGGLDMQAGARSTEDLVQLVKNTKEKATVILRGISGRTTDELVHISRNSTGSVVFALE